MQNEKEYGPFQMFIRFGIDFRFQHGTTESYVKTKAFTDYCLRYRKHA